MKKKNRILLPLISVILLLAATITAIVAWYTTSNRNAQTDSNEIEIPPIIYIRDDNMDEMKSFDLAGLEKGTVYNFVFCVMPAKKGTAVNFQLAVAYTGNLGMDISLYPVTNIASSPSGTYIERTLEDKMAGGTGSYYFSYDPTNPSWATCVIKKADGKTNKEENQNPNDGTRKTYTDLTFATTGTDNPSSYVEELNDQRNYRFFVMNIEWASSTNNTSDEKEVDIIYIIANGSPA